MKALTRMSAISLVLFACQPAAKTEAEKPKDAKSGTVEKAKDSVTEKVTDKSSDASKEPEKEAEKEKGQEKEEVKKEEEKKEEVKDPISDPVPVAKKNGDPLYSADEVSKVTYIKVYTYFGPDAPAANYIFADLASGKVGRSADPGKVRQIKGALSAAEIQKIRDAIAAIKVYVPASSVCDPSNYNANFRADIKINGKLEKQYAYAFHNCVKDKLDYVNAVGLIDLNNQHLSSPLVDKEMEEVDEPKL